MRALVTALMIMTAANSISCADDDDSAAGDGDADADADADGQATCSNVCDHAASCGDPAFDRAYCEADCACDTGELWRADLVQGFVECMSAVECEAGQDAPALCLHQLDFEPTETAASAVAECETLVADACPGQEMCVYVAALRDDRIPTFEHCLTLDTCEAALECFFGGSVELCPDLAGGE